MKDLLTSFFFRRQKKPLEEEATAYVNAEKEVAIRFKKRINGAKDIIAEIIADIAEYRKRIREMYMKQKSL